LQDLGLIKRWAFSRLIAKADILTVLSAENLKVARTLFPHIRSEFIPFGINVDELAPLKKEKFTIRSESFQSAMIRTAIGKF